MRTTNVSPSAIGAEGVITSLLAGHCVPFWALPLTCGEQAGGFGFVALTGFAFETACAAGSGSSWPFGSPGYVGWTNRNDAGVPLIATEFTVMFGPVPSAVCPFVCSKSKLRSLRHWVDFTWRSACVPGRNVFAIAS